MTSLLIGLSHVAPVTAGGLTLARLLAGPGAAPPPPADGPAHGTSERERVADLLEADDALTLLATHLL